MDGYGLFIQSIIDFLVIALVIFFLIRAINLFNKKKEKEVAAPPVPYNEEILLAEIRDILKEK